MKKFISIFILIILIVGCVCALFACAPKDSGTPASTYIISFNTNGGSAIKSVTLKSGSLLTLPDAPVKEGYVFTGWFLDNECQREVNVALFRVVSNTTIFAGWESVDTYRHFIDFDLDIEDGTLKVVSPEDGRASYGTEVMISVVPDDGYELVEGSLKANDVELVYHNAQIYKFIMPKSSVIITCDFDLAPLPVSLIGGGFDNGLVVLSTDSARPGEQVSVQAIPDFGYRLSELYVLNNNLDSAIEPVKVSIINSSQFYMGNREALVGAKFEKIDYNTLYNVNVASSQGGVVNVDSASSPAGLFVGVDIIPNEGYKLDSLIVNGENWTTFIKADGDGFIMPSENVTVNVRFSLIKEEDEDYELTINQPDNGLVIIKNAKHEYKEGERVVLETTPDAGYVLKDLFVNGVGIIGDSFVMPNENSTITAEFVKKGHKIDLISYNCEILLSQPTAYEGDLVYFEIVVNEGYNVSPSSITLDGVRIKGNYFVMPANDVVLSATAYSTGTTYEINVPTVQGGNIVPNVTEANIYEKVTLKVLPNYGLRLKPNSLVITYLSQGVEKSEILDDLTFIMPDTSVTITAEFEKAFKVNANENDNVSVFPSISEIGVNETVWFDVVAHGNVITNSVSGKVNFGLYSEPLNLLRNFKLTEEILRIAGDNPQLSVVIDSYLETNTSRSFSITINDALGGIVEVEGSKFRPYGQIIRLLVEAEEGYELEGLSLSTNSGDNYPISDTFVMPDSMVTITPNFKEKEERGFSLSAGYTQNLSAFRNAGIKLEYFKEKYQLIDKYPSLSNHKFLNYLVGAVKADANVGHDFYILEVNNVDKVNPIAHKAHEFIATQLNVPKSEIQVYINYNYIVLSVGGNPVEDFYVYKNGVLLVGDFVIYERRDGTYGVYAYQGNSSYVTILSQYSERSVSYLSSKAFKYPENVKGVNLSNLKEIGDFALENTAISYLDIKDVANLGKGVFKGCKYLKAFTASELNTNYSVKEGVLYTKQGSANYTTLYAYPTAKTVSNDSYLIEKTVTAIAPYAFYGTTLKTVSYGGALTTIGDYAFANSSIESIKYTSATAIKGVVDFSTSNVNKSSVAVIGTGVFKGAKALNTFYLDTVTYIGDEAIVWDGNGTMVINLPSSDVGVVSCGVIPIVLPNEISGNLIINLSYDLRDLYLSNSQWLKYSNYFVFK